MGSKRYTTTGDYLAMLRRMIAATGKRVGHADIAELTELIAIRADLDDAIRTAIDGLRARRLYLGVDRFRVRDHPAGRPDAMGSP